MPRLQNFETQWPGAAHAHREEIEGRLLEGEVANEAHAHLPHPDIKDVLPSSKVLLIWTFSHPGIPYFCTKSGATAGRSRKRAICPPKFNDTKGVWGKSIVLWMRWNHYIAVNPTVSPVGFNCAFHSFCQSMNCPIVIPPAFKSVRDSSNSPLELLMRSLKYASASSICVLRRVCICSLDNRPSTARSHSSTLFMGIRKPLGWEYWRDNSAKFSFSFLGYRWEWRDHLILLGWDINPTLSHAVDTDRSSTYLFQLSSQICNHFALFDMYEMRDLKPWAVGELGAPQIDESATWGRRENNLLG